MNIIIGLLTAASFGIITLFALIAIGSPIVADLDVRVPEFLMERFFYTGDSINDELTIEAQQYENIEKRDLRIDLGAGKFSVKDVVSEDYLQVDAYYYDGIGEPDLTSAFKNQKLDIDFDIRSGALNWGGKTRTPEYDFLIGRQDIPTNLFVNLGVGSAALNLDGLEIENVSFDVGGGDMEIDISGLEVKKFESEVGSGQMNINLRNSEVAQGIDIKVGAGRIKLTVPSDVGYSIQYDLGLGTINTPQEDISGSNKGNIVSPNYESASKILDIKLEVGVGRFEIDY
jgi:hypothetical protein